MTISTNNILANTVNSFLAAIFILATIAGSPSQAQTKGPSKQDFGSDNSPGKELDEQDSNNLRGDRVRNATTPLRRRIPVCRGLENRKTRGFEFARDLNTFKLSGDAVIEFAGNCLDASPVEYLLKSAGRGFGMQTGSSFRISDPVVDESNPRLTVWSFDAVQGPNSYFGNESLHVIHSQNGLMFCEWNANCRIEIKTANGEVTKIWNGQFKVVGGTGVYRFATGSWDFAMMTEPNLDELSAIAHFEFSGEIDLGDLAVDFETTGANVKE